MPISPELSKEVGKRLHQSRDDILAAARSRIDGDPPVINPGAHIGQSDDMSAAEMLTHNEEHLAEHETALLHDIDVALGRLESGGYGICVRCGNEISEARLLATPTVQTCIKCQEEIEHEQHRGRGPSM